eukprot:gene4472-8906_t
MMLFVSAILIGLDKGGLPGVAALAVALLASDSHGSFIRNMALMVPVLSFADFGAVFAFWDATRKDVIQLLIVPIFIGVIIGFTLIGSLEESIIRTMVGFILLVLTAMHYLVKALSGKVETVLPLTHSSQLEKLNILDVPIALVTALVAGIFTVLANVAGPIITVYLLHIGLSKRELNGTRACLFAMANAVKIPLQIFMGNIKLNDIMLLIPLISIAFVSTLLTEKYILSRLKQETFVAVTWAFVTLGAIKLASGY